MADKIKKNEFVYVTATGKKYHLNSTCSYIKNKESYKISLEEAKIKFEGACYRCFKNNNQSINSKIGINNNFNLNIIQNNKNNLILNNNNNEKQYELNIKENNQIQIKNNNLLSNIIKEESKNIKKQKNSLSDILSSSSSFSKIIDKNKLSDNKDSDIDFNNNININKIYKEDLFNIKNNNPIKIRKDINNSSESGKLNSLIKQNYNKIILKNGEEKNEDILNDIKNNSKNINIIKDSKNKKSFLSKNDIINNKSFDFNKGKNNSSINYFSDTNQKDLSINKSISEPKSNSFRIYYNNKIYSRSNINNNENDIFSSFSMSNIKIEIKHDIKKNNIKNNQNIKENKESNINFNNTSSLNNQLNLSCSQDKDIYKFSFKIIPKGKNDINISIELGFEIIIIEDDNNENNSENEESSESSEKSITLSNTYQKYYIFKCINIHKKTKNIIALIDISKGKFYILSNTNENLDISLDNNIILSSSDCQKIPLDKIKEVYPIFKYDSKYLNFVDIFFNGKLICL